jgi:hypothetical protein
LDRKIVPFSGVRTSKIESQRDTFTFIVLNFRGMNIEEFLIDWLEVSNDYQVEKYLDKYLEDAVLDDPSVGKKFNGHAGIREYYTSYFIGYKTQTRLVSLDVSENTAHMEVEFTGDFPEGKLGGIFDFTFRNGKIVEVKADLL